MATDTVLSIWQRLDQLAPWALALYGLALMTAASLTAWFGFRLFYSKNPAQLSDDKPLIEGDLRASIAAAQSEGVAVEASQRELDILDRRRALGKVHIAVFGQASEGKSSLINALLPDARQDVGVTAGTTQSIRRFDSDGALVLVDLPGFGLDESSPIEQAARREALRAHLVLYVASGDLDRRQAAELGNVLGFEKPTILVLNKSDRYSDDELSSIRERLTRLAEGAPVATVTAGGEEQITVVADDGSESSVLRRRPVDITHLRATIDQLLVETDVDEAFDETMLKLAASELKAAENHHRREAADELIERYARRAVIGALAALTPGSDLVIQGALATKLYHDLCKLYQQPARNIDLDRFLSQAGGRVRRTTAVVLAVAGNALKAFPGIGTVTGGLVHAVAYGMIFRSLGKAASEALARDSVSAHGPDEAAIGERFEALLKQSGASEARRYASLAIEHLRQTPEETR